MKKIYLTKMYIKFNDENVSTKSYRIDARPLNAYGTKDIAINALKRKINAERTKRNSLYKKYFFIEEMELL